MQTAALEEKTFSLTEIVAAALAEAFPDGAAQPCFYWTGCGRRAEIEKAGRSVCSSCAANLRGAEYPLRQPSAESLYASDRQVAEALDMVEDRPDDAPPAAPPDACLSALDGDEPEAE